MGRLANSWETTKASWGVLKKDKELLWFPIFSGLASLIVMASFIAPTLVSGIVDRAVEQEDPNAQQLLAVLYFVMYLVLAFVTIYFNAALIHAANERLSGGDPTVGSGLKGANARLGKIFAWALFTGTVSLLLHLLERASRGRNNLVANIVVRMVGVAWALATYFVIPVLLFEDQGVFSSLRRSGQLFRQRWGESLVGFYGIGMVFGLLSMLVMVVTFLLAYALSGLGSAFLPIALGAVALGIVTLAFLTILGSALGGVYRAALYRFAVQGQTPPGFAPHLIENAWRPAGGTR